MHSKRHRNDNLRHGEGTFGACEVKKDYYSGPRKGLILIIDIVIAYIIYI